MEKYFKSQKEMYEFILIYLSGRQRNKLLSVESDMFYNKKLAEAWYNNIKGEIEDSEAIKRLEDLYKLMIG